MRILFIADVVGKGGTELLLKRLPALKNEYKPDLTIVNGENAAAGNGIDASAADAIFSAGADVITGGNHSFDRRDDSLFDRPYILRPLNWRTDVGKGSAVYDAVRWKAAVVSLSGTVNMVGNHENPFLSVKEEIKKLKTETDTVFVDFHAEATSEKKAMGLWLAGEVAAVIGTHTHCQTADAEIIKGTAYITDAGFTGSKNSVLGVAPKEVVERFALGSREKLLQLDEPPYMINGVFIETENGKAVSIETVMKIYQR